MTHVNRAGLWFLAATVGSGLGILIGHPYTLATIVGDVLFAIVATAVEAYLTIDRTPKPPTGPMRFA